MLILLSLGRAQPRGDLRIRGEQRTDPRQLRVRTAQNQLQALCPKKVSMQGIVAVEADSSVDVLGSGDHAMRTICGTQLGDGELAVA